MRVDRDSLLRGQAALDAEVWMVLEASDVALTAVEIHLRLARPIVYSTVLTSLKRLLVRGDVDRLRHERTVRWAATDDGAGVAAREMLRALDATGGTGRSAALARFASILDPADRSELLHAVTRADVSRGRCPAPPARARDTP